MLILSRKTGEKVVIETPGGDVEVCVTNVRGGTVAVGFNAPKDFNIRRAEIPRLNDGANTDGNRESNNLRLRPLRTKK